MPQPPRQHGPTWTLITVTHNSGEALRRCWSGVEKLDAVWIVVDNASTDDSREQAAQLGAHVIANPDNSGFSAANNLGLAAALSPLVAFVNPDVMVGQDCLSELEAHLARHGGLVAPQLCNPDGTLQPNGRGLPTPWAKLGNRIRGRRCETGDAYRLYAPPHRSVPVSWAMGAFVAAKRTDFASVGGWNDSYFIYYEDAELGIRAARLGLLTTVCGTATAVHEWARDTTRWRWRPWLFELRSGSRFYSAHLYLLLPAWCWRVFPAFVRQYRKMSAVPCDHVPQRPSVDRSRVRDAYPRLAP